MRAALCSTYGGPEVIAVTDIDPPPLGAGEVRIRVHIGAINFPDLLVIANTYQMSAPLPFVTGSEFAGMVSEIGDGVAGSPSASASSAPVSSAPSPTRSWWAQGR